MISSWDCEPHVDISDRELGYKSLESCRIILEDIPQRFHGQQFIKFFEHCSLHYCVCMALYRAYKDADINTPLSQKSDDESDAMMEGTTELTELDEEERFRDLRCTLHSH